MENGVVLAEETGSGVHYDIPPGVFELLLDRNMNYSSGCYPGGTEDLDSAQIAKMDKIARLLGLRRGDRVLDAGCGWSGPALYLAETHGCHVTGVTLSPSQRDYALRWAESRGLSGHIAVEVRDVMDLSYSAGSFDAIMFLESIIHMPEKKAVFARCRELLKVGGRLVVQESHYDRAGMRDRYLSDRGFREVNEAFGFTGDLVSGGQMLCLMEDAGLIPESVDNISGDYIRTLSSWLGNLDQNADRMRAISERAYTMLRRYLMIALATYRSGGTVCYQIAARKCRG